MKDRRISCDDFGAGANGPSCGLWMSSSVRRATKGEGIPGVPQFVSASPFDNHMTDVY